MFSFPDMPAVGVSIIIWFSQDYPINFVIVVVGVAGWLTGYWKEVFDHDNNISVNKKHNNNKYIFLNILRIFETFMFKDILKKAAKLKNYRIQCYRSFFQMNF